MQVIDADAYLWITTGGGIDRSRDDQHGRDGCPWLEKQHRTKLASFGMGAITNALHLAFDRGSPMRCRARRSGAAFPRKNQQFFTVIDGESRTLAASLPVDKVVRTVGQFKIDRLLTLRTGFQTRSVYQTH